MPFSGEHACRLQDPGNFREDSFVRVSRETEDGKAYDVIRAEHVTDGEMQDQSHRYPVENWTEGEARQHCRDHDGQKFEPAADGDQDNEGRLRINTGQVGAPRYLHSLADQIWAVQSPAVLREMAAIGMRQGNLQAVERYHSEQADDAAKVRIRNGVAVVPVMGPIFPRANLMSMVSGATSVDILARDLQRMADRSDIRAIMLEIDSPGGVVTDVDQMAGVISEISRQKPVTAYVGGTAASAAYWLATAASEIVVARTGQVGGIGVVATVSTQKEPDDAGMMDFEIVSANAGEKRPDPESDEGRNTILDRINPIEATFIETVAENRGVSVETVRNDFGRGNVVVGNAAVRRRMADRVGTFESVLNDLQQVPFSQPESAAASVAHSQPQTAKEDLMSNEVEGTAEAQTSANSEPETKAANPADIADLCHQAGVPQLSASLIRDGATYEQAQTRVRDVGLMQDHVENAVRLGLNRDTADGMREAAVKAGKSEGDLRAELWDTLVKSQSEDNAVQSHISPDTLSKPDAANAWADKFAKVRG